MFLSLIACDTNCTVVFTTCKMPGFYPSNLSLGIINKFVALAQANAMTAGILAMYLLVQCLTK